MQTEFPKLFTRQEILSSYKSVSKCQQASPSQVFGLIPETSFSKLSLPPRSLQWISQYNLYAACDEKHFVVFDKSGNIKKSANVFESFRIPLCLTFIYIEKYHCFALISSDFKLLIVSVLLDLWKTVQLPGRINHIEYYKDILFLGGTSKITAMHFKFDTVYDIEKCLLLDPDRGFVNFIADKIHDLNFNIKWIKGMKISKSSDIFVLWSECKVILFNLPSCSFRAEAEDLCPGTLITSVLYSPEQDYLIAATTLGSVYVYKVGSVFKPVHVFKGHSRGVPTLELISSHFFITASLDFSLKLWSLEHFRLLYSFELPFSDSFLPYLSLISTSTLACSTSSALHILYINLIGKLMFISVSSAKYIKMVNGNITVIGEDNSIVLYKYQKVVTTIYPPPSAHDLKDIIFIPEINRVLVLLDSGVMCLFSIEGKTGLLEKMLRIGDIYDYEMKPVSSPIQCIKRVKLRPPQYDCELVFRKRLNHEKKPNSFLAMSAGKGMIIFMSAEKIDRVYARFALHRETILNIEEVQNYLITICAGNLLVVSYFHENMINILKKIELKLQPSFLRGLEPDKFFISFNTGQSEIIQIEDNQLLRLVNKELDSDTLVTSVDVEQESSILATATSSNLVQIWTFDKQLLDEIKFPHPINSLLLSAGAVYVSYKQITTSISVKNRFDSGIVETEKIPDNYFRLYVPQIDEMEEIARIIERERTSDKMSVFRSTFESKPKIKSEAALKKTKCVTRRPKQLKKESKSAEKLGKKDPLYSLKKEIYKSSISKKIPVFVNSKSVRNSPLLTRRELTEEKIIRNIKEHGDPADNADYRNIRFMDKREERLYFEQLAKSKNRIT